MTKHSPFLLSVCQLLKEQSVDLLEQSTRLILECARIDGTVFTCGNGGSSANAIHFSSDLATGGHGGRQFRTFSLNANLAAISAIGNDIGYDEIFSYQLKPLISSRDILIAFSVSGTSPNILLATALAKTCGAKVISFTRENSSELVKKSDVAFMVQHESFGVVESAHLCIAHALSEMVTRYQQHSHEL